MRIWHDFRRRAASVPDAGIYQGSRTLLGNTKITTAFSHFPSPPRTVEMKNVPCIFKRTYYFSYVELNIILKNIERTPTYRDNVGIAHHIRKCRFITCTTAYLSSSTSLKTLKYGIGQLSSLQICFPVLNFSEKSKTDFSFANHSAPQCFSKGFADELVLLLTWLHQNCLKITKQKHFQDQVDTGF